MTHKGGQEAQCHSSPEEAQSCLPSSHCKQVCEMHDQQGLSAQQLPNLLACRRDASRHRRLQYRQGHWSPGGSDGTSREGPGTRRHPGHAGAPLAAVSPSPAPRPLRQGPPAPEIERGGTVPAAQAPLLIGRQGTHGAGLPCAPAGEAAPCDLTPVLAGSKRCIRHQHPRACLHTSTSHRLSRHGASPHHRQSSALRGWIHTARGWRRDAVT